MQVKRGEFETMVRTHQASLYRYARYLGADRAAAEDIVQEAFLAALRASGRPARDRIRDRDAWLRGVTRNVFLSHYRRMSASPVRADSRALESAERTWAADFLRQGDGFDYLEALRDCLERLPDRQRQVLDMHYAQGKGRAELAEVMKMTVEGIKSMMRRMRQALADCVRRRMGLEET
jgi:RNA polymerase sigma-70 factor (ECF subfamily)